MYPMESIEYLTECTLATVEDMAAKKSVSKCEYKRQILIAQYGINCLKEKEKTSGRCSDVLSRGITVEQYASEIRKKYVKNP